MNEPKIPLGIVIIGVMLCIAAIVCLMKYIQQVTTGLQPREYMLKVIFTAFILLVGVFAVDKVIALRRDLLTDTESNTVFAMIKDVMLIVVSFYFGTQVNNNKS